MEIRPQTPQEQELLLNALFALAKVRLNQTPSLNASGTANPDIQAMRDFVRTGRIGIHEPEACGPAPALPRCRNRGFQLSNPPGTDNYRREGS
jgi:hypothetical protein